MRYLSFILVAVTTCAGNEVLAQKAGRYLYKGNEHYKKQEYDKSVEQYRQALAEKPNDPVANYNLGNALFRQGKLEDATQAFNNTIEQSSDKALKEQGYYNKGVALIKQNKLEESIDAWKNALKLDPNDQQARENLQKALRELKKKQEQQKKDQKQKKDKKEEQKDQEQKKKEQEPPPSKLSKQRVEQLLRALQQKEKEVQDRLQKEKASSRQPEKDW